MHGSLPRLCFFVWWILPILKAVESAQCVEEHVEQTVVQQDVRQLGTGIQQLQQHTQGVVHQRVLVQGVLNQAQHRDNAALPERRNLLHLL